MAVTEHGRIVLYRHFEAEMGEEKARTLMDHLLPVGWSDLATKDELRATEHALRHEIQVLRLELKADIADLRTEMHKAFRAHLFALMGLMVTMQGFTIATLRLV